MLPEVRKVKMPTLTLPCAWQTVIFRNFGYVKSERLAETLSCSIEALKTEAERLGLRDFGFADDFETRGYITLIRNNWFLLPYEQLLTLLGIDEKRLDFILENDDFLSVKLGNFKPLCEKVTYLPLTADQLAETERIAKSLSPYIAEPENRPFDFFGTDSSFSPAFGQTASPDGLGSDKPTPETAGRGRRIVHGYLSPCGDAFLTDCSDTLPEALLEKYQAAGVGGIWLHGLLSALSPYPFLPELSNGFEMRRNNLKKLIKRCKKYSISVYLYINEPRALPVGVDERYEKLIGWQEKRTLCLTHPEVKEYLYNAVYDLCSSVPDLGGIFTITMSENPTHCHYLPDTECLICKGIPPEETTAEINNIFARAMRESGCVGELIANLWGWSPYMGWSEDQILRGIELLDPDISVMCVSEYDLEIEKGGVRSRVIDYSISNPGPSEITKKLINKAKECGHRVYAKIQASNSWECAAVPYIPAFDLVAEHLENLYALGVNDLFLTWTQGGYPSPSVSLACEFDGSFDLDKWYENNFGDDSVRGAIELFCKAFREYPFSVNALYLSPHTLASANLWDIEPEEKQSTMVCFSYDDMESWVEPYGADIYLSQMDIVCWFWEEGIELLELAEKNAKTEELMRYAKAVCCHFKSDLLQTKFSLYKREKNICGMIDCLCKERENAKELLSLMRCDAKIGYEASNHYFYTERSLLEKIIRTEKLERLLEMKD